MTSGNSYCSKCVRWDSLTEYQPLVRLCPEHAAAPDLLAALRGLVCELESINAPAPGLIHAKKAIAKAEGRKP